MQRFNIDLTSQLALGQFIKTVGSSGTPELLHGGVKQVLTVQAVADVSGSLKGTYFDLADSNGPVRVWFTVGGVGVQPAAPVYGRSIVVNVVSGDSAGNVAAAINTVLDADAEFVSTVLTDTVTVTQASVGKRQGPSAGTSGFATAQTTAGVDKKLLVDSVSFTGQKARATDNAGNVFLGYSATNDTQLFAIAPGKTVTMRAPAGASIDLGRFYLDVATNNDGLIVSYPGLSSVTV